MLCRVTPDSSPGFPSPSQQGSLLYNKWWLDVPKLLDIAALYGPSNKSLVGQLLQQLVKLQPKYLQVGRLLVLQWGGLLYRAYRGWGFGIGQLLQQLVELQPK